MCETRMTGVFNKVVIASLVAAWAWAGCAEAQLGEDLDAGDEPTTCEVLADCAFDELCRNGVCVEADPDGGGDSGRPVDGGDVGDVDVGGDLGPCGGGCGPGGRCTDAGCVSRCDSGCRSGQKCRDIGDGYQCYEQCETPLTARDCEQPGTLCWDVGADGGGADLLCKPSACSTHQDCPREGTCLRFEHDFGACTPSGDLEVGETCGMESGTYCERGARCFGGNGSDEPPTCVKLCDPWADSPDCADGQRCSLFRYQSGAFDLMTTRQGFCNGNVDPEGREPMDRCQSPQNLCDHATRCYARTEETRCTRWCRPEADDCTGALPSGGDRPAVCDNYTFPGERRIGRCVRRCDGKEHCESGEQCVEGLCRTTCESTAQCCSGPGRCEWTCRDGLCQ